MKLYIARHGESNYNHLGLCNDDPSVDVHLTEKGLEQAHALAEELKDVQFEHVYVSELHRTKQTAVIVNKRHHATISVDARLNDNKSGFEGKPHKDYIAALDAAKDPWTATFNGGESLEDVKARVEDFLNDLRHEDFSSVLIVTSRVIIRMMSELLDDVPGEKAITEPVPNGSFVEFELKK